MSKKSKIIYLLLVIAFISFISYKYKQGKLDSIIFAGKNSNYYFTISNTGYSLGTSGSLLELITYNNEGSKEGSFKLKNSDNNIRVSSIKYNDNSIFLYDMTYEQIYTTNIETGESKIVVDGMENPEDTFAIKDFEVSNNKIIYSFVSKDGSHVNIKDLSTGETINIFNSNIHAEIPVSIYADKAAYLLNKAINLYSIDSKKLISTSIPSYEGDLLLYEDVIYTFKSMENGMNNLVALSLDFNNKLSLESTILESVLAPSSLYPSNNRIVFDNYFYDLNDKKLYVRMLNGSYDNGNNLLIGDYIYSENSKYEKLEYGKNYTEYKLSSPIETAQGIPINDNKVINILFDGSVAITESNTNNILDSFNGFRPKDSNSLLRDFAYSDNKLYGIVKQINSPPQIMSMDITNGNLRVVKQIINDTNSLNNITQIAVFENKVGYLSKHNNDFIFTIYDMTNNTTSTYKLDSKEYIQDIYFNNDYIVFKDFDDKTIKSYNISNGKTTTFNSDNYVDLLGIVDNGIAINYNSNYKIIDFDFNELLTFSNYDKLIDYLYKE